jgi:hypothetical protein
MIVSLPTGAVDAVHDPDPLTRLAEHSVVAPSANATEPVGVPLVELTVAE